MTTKHTKGYTKSKIGQMDAIALTKLLSFNEQMLKNPNEPLDKWIIRKAEESIAGGTDEQTMNRKEDGQSPKPLA